MDKTPRRESKAMLDAPINHLNNWNTGRKSHKSHITGLRKELLIESSVNLDSSEESPFKQIETDLK